MSNHPWACLAAICLVVVAIGLVISSIIGLMGYFACSICTGNDGGSGNSKGRLKRSKRIPGEQSAATTTNTLTTDSSTLKKKGSSHLPTTGSSKTSSKATST